jgi:GTP-binding protein
VSNRDLGQCIEDTGGKVRKRPAAFPDILVTSSEKAIGLDELRDAVLSATAG